MTQRQKTRKNGANGDLCKECGALCCRDLAMMITKPRTSGEVEELMWYLRFDTVTIAIRNYRWHLVTRGRCIYLTRNNRCRIYDKRPGRCRRHQPPECEHFGQWYDTALTTPDDLTRYLNGKRK